MTTPQLWASRAMCSATAGAWLLEEVLGGNGVDLVQPGGEAGPLAVPSQLESRVFRSPDDLHGVGPIAQDAVVQRLFLGGALEASHDPQERAAAVALPKEVDIGVELLVRNRARVPDALQAHQQPERRLREGAKVCLADPATRERLHRPRALERGDVHQRVQHRQRSDSLGHRRRQLEPDRAPDVVHDQVKALEPQHIYSADAEPAEAGPAVVELHRPLGQPEAGQVERHPA